jgi:hypothetical protein
MQAANEKTLLTGAEADEQGSISFLSQATIAAD